MLAWISKVNLHSARKRRKTNYNNYLLFGGWARVMVEYYRILFD